MVVGRITIVVVAVTIDCVGQVIVIIIMSALVVVDVICHWNGFILVHDSEEDRVREI